MRGFLLRRRTRRNRVQERRARQQRFFLAICLYLLVGAVSWMLLGGPALIRPSGAPADSVSGINGVAEIQNLLGPEELPHAAGSPANSLVRERLVARLRGLGLEVAEIPFQFDKFQLVNVLCRRPGSPHPRPVLFVCHYDSIRVASGAGDPMSSVGGIIESIRSLQSSNLTHEVWYLFTDGEEMGMRGAAEFVRSKLPWGEAKPLVFNFDARGTTGVALMFETHAENYSMLSKLSKHLARPIFTNSLMYEVYKTLPNNTDFSVFKSTAHPGMNFALIGSAHHYHTPNDKLANLSPRSVQHVAQHARNLASAIDLWTPSDWASLEPSINAIYFDILGGPVIVYPAYVNVILTIVCLALLVAMIIRKGQIEQLRSERLVLLVSSMVALVAIVFVVGAGFSWMLEVIEVLDRKFVEGGDGFCLIYPVLAIGVASALGARSFGRVNTLQARLSIMAIFTLLAICATTLIPGAAYLFHGPCIVFGVSALLAPYDRWTDALNVAVTSVFFVPLLQLLTWAIGPTHGGILSAVAALSLLPALPFFADVYPHRENAEDRGLNEVATASSPVNS